MIDSALVAIIGIVVIGYLLYSRDIWRRRALIAESKAVLAKHPEWDGWKAHWWHYKRQEGCPACITGTPD